MGHSGSNTIFNTINKDYNDMIRTDDKYQDIRDAIRDLCSEFSAEYFRKVDEERGYPTEFVKALTDAGWLAALIPEEYGGSGLSLTEASVIMEEINRNGGNSGACHGQMYNMGTLLRHGSEAQKQLYEASTLVLFSFINYLRCVFVFIFMRNYFTLFISRNCYTMKPILRPISPILGCLQTDLWVLEGRWCTSNPKTSLKPLT